MGVRRGSTRIHRWVICRGCLNSQARASLKFQLGVGAFRSQLKCPTPQRGAYGLHRGPLTIRGGESGVRLAVWGTSDAHGRGQGEGQGDSEYVESMLSVMPTPILRATQLEGKVR